MTPLFDDDNGAGVELAFAFDLVDVDAAGNDVAVGGAVPDEAVFDEAGLKRAGHEPAAGVEDLDGHGRVVGIAVLEDHDVVVLVPVGRDVAVGDARRVEDEGVACFKSLAEPPLELLATTEELIAA